MSDFYHVSKGGETHLHHESRLTATPIHGGQLARRFTSRCCALSSRACEKSKRRCSGGSVR